MFCAINDRSTFEQYVTFACIRHVLWLAEVSSNFPGTDSRVESRAQLRKPYLATLTNNHAGSTKCQNSAR
jgi:hypothetical protein